jgi:hypothetical protein
MQHVSAGGAGIAVVLLALAACATSGGRTIPVPVQAPAPAGAVDASYDWHVLVVEPFGTLLKESPVPLHEVLLFHDQAHAAAENESRDCFAIDGAPPRFVGQTPDHYLLCFDHDHLTRIEASVRLIAGDAPGVFARACSLWLKNTAPASSGTTCEGREEAVAFSAVLSLLPGDAATLSMTVSHTAHEK